MISQAYQWGETARSAQKRDDRARARAMACAVLAIACNILKYIANCCRIAAAGISNVRQRFVRLTVGSRSYLQWAWTVGIGNGRAICWHSGQNCDDTVGEANGCRITPVRVGNHAQQLGSPSSGRIAPVGEQNCRAAVGITQGRHK